MAHDGRVPRKRYERELLRLQGELVEVQEWVRVEKERVVVIFEGRDGAGKGGVITRITHYLNPRVARIVAFPAQRAPEDPVVLPTVRAAPAGGR